MGRSHSRSVDCLAGEARRFRGNRRAWKRVTQLSNINADLQFDRGRALSGVDRVCHPRHSPHFESGSRDRRLDPGKRREALSLSDYDPTDQMNDETQMTNDERNSNAQMTKRQLSACALSLGFRHSFVI